MNNMTASDLLRSGPPQNRNLSGQLDLSFEAPQSSRSPGIRQDFLAIQSLAGVHFEKEERVFYPEVRPECPELLAHMDQEHEVVRETERGLE